MAAMFTLLFSFQACGHSDVVTTTPMGGSLQGQALALTPTVAVFAGTLGIRGSVDGIGLAAQFNDPNGITTDGTNLYVADSNDKTIKKIVISTAEVTTIAGTSGVSGTTSGIGAAARFGWPSGITTDGTNLYIADNSSVRKMVIATKEVTTLVSGGSVPSTYGITTDGTNLYVACRGLGVVKVVIATGVATTIPGTTGFTFVHGITTDGTNIYFTEDVNYTLQKIAISSGAVSTLAGSGVNSRVDGVGTAASFAFPAGITTDGTYLYVGEEGSGYIRKVEISTGTVTSIAPFPSFSGYLTTDGVSLFVTDRGLAVVRKIN